jgi:predicted ATPase
MTPSWYVLTGAPSSGKSTLAEELSGRGYRIVHEAAREVIEKYLAQGRTLEQIRGDATSFQTEVLRQKVRTEAELPRNEVVFLDRGIPDSIAYYAVENVQENDELHVAVRNSKYRKVFILDLISQENFVRDDARSEQWENALALDIALEEAYKSLGYDVVRVPVVPVTERAKFVLMNL